MRKPLLYVFAAFVVMTLAPNSRAANHPQKPGKWRVTVQMEMADMPVKMPPMTHEQCITEDDVKDPQKAVPNDPKSQCKVGEFKVDGKTVHWTIDCPKQKTTGEGEITFGDDDTYKGTMTMHVSDKTMTMNYTGKRLGDCEK